MKRAGPPPREVVASSHLRLHRASTVSHTSAMRPLRHPVDGDTRQCPKCRNTLVFRSRYPILLIGVVLERTGAEPADRIRYERGWVCRNGACDYRESDVLADADTARDG
jgi:hypothetical protein